MPRKESTYDEAQIQKRLDQLNGWYYEAGALCRAYRTDGWPTTLMLVNAIGYAAEAADHHPDLSVTWGRVIVKLWTHSAGGVTEKDFAMARRFDEVALWRPAPGEALAGRTPALVGSDDPPAPDAA